MWRRFFLSYFYSKGSTSTGARARHVCAPATRTPTTWFRVSAVRHACGWLTWLPLFGMLIHGSFTGSVHTSCGQQDTLDDWGGWLCPYGSVQLCTAITTRGSTSPFLHANMGVVLSSDPQAGNCRGVVVRCWRKRSGQLSCRSGAQNGSQRWTNGCKDASIEHEAKSMKPRCA
jgi:hypothetical protein